MYTYDGSYLSHVTWLLHILNFSILISPKIITLMTSNPPAQRSTSTAVASATAQANKPPCNIHPTAVVAEKASITGTYQVDIGEHCILHPYAKIRAEGGKVSIGAFCTISEAAVVGSIAEHTGNVVLGDHVVIDSGAQVEAASIGDGTEVGIKAIVGHGTVIGKV